MHVETVLTIPHSCMQEPRAEEIQRKTTTRRKVTPRMVRTRKTAAKGEGGVMTDDGSDEEDVVDADDSSDKEDVVDTEDSSNSA